MKAAVATDVSVDLEGLDCTLCLDLLRPPVFQCAAGHVICSTCYEKLLENDYCQLCSVNASYSRCFAVERVLHSVKVPCSNVGYGCMAKMPYYEIEDHEMNCLKGVRDFSGSNTVQSMPLHHGLPTDYYTLLIPKVSPSLRMNISINNPESKIGNRDDKKMHDKKSSTCDNKSSTGSVVKMGLCGGGGGNAWKMDLRGVNRIVKVVVRHGHAVDAMSVFYEQEGKEKKTKLWGGTGGKRSECAAGHVLCLICYEKLPEKEKCQVCSIATGYNRCFAMERVLQSLQVFCSNADKGCTAKMSYHEMEEHEKECPRAVCDCTGSNTMKITPLHQGLSTDCYTLVIPKVSPSTSIKVTINNGEIKKKIHYKKSSTDSVVKMGPCGGGGGYSWKMDMRGINRILRLVVRHGRAVDAMSVLYERDGQAEESKLWGGTGGEQSEICLRQDEYLTSVKGHCGFFNNSFVIRSLTFVSNHRTFGPYGKEEGTQFKLPAAGGKILGFHVRSGWYQMG